MGSPFFNQHRFDECISIISLPYIYKLNLEIYSYTHPNKVEESNSRMLVIQSTERPSSGISLSSNNFTRHIPVYSQRIEASPPSRRGGEEERQSGTPSPLPSENLSTVLKCSAGALFRLSDLVT